MLASLGGLLSWPLDALWQTYTFVPPHSVLLRVVSDRRALSMADQEKDVVKQVDTTPQTLEELRNAKTIDTLHSDEAIRVLAQYAGDLDWTPEEERRLVRRLDRKLISLLVTTYGLQYYDKAMLSQAALFGLRDDLRLTSGNRYSFSSAIFYLGFIVGSYPAILMSQRWPIERVAAGIVAIWGVCLMCSAACTNWQGKLDVFGSRTIPDTQQAFTPNASSSAFLSPACPQCSC